MNDTSRQRFLALILGLILVALLAYRGGLFKGAGPRLFGGGGGISKVEVGDVAEVDFDSLSKKPREFHLGRDPWRYATSSTTTVPRVLPTRTTTSTIPILRQAPEESLPVPPDIDVIFLGSFGPPGGRIAVFTDDSDAIYNALVGDVLKGKFRVVQILYESVDLEYVGFPNVEPARLPMGG